MKTIIIGIGNPILGDDGIGIHIVRKLQKNMRLLQNVTIDEAQTGGINLLDIIRGYDKVILIDAINNFDLAHGAVQQFSIDELPTIHSNNPHDVSFPEALLLAEKLGDTNIPKDITIIGINLREIPKEFGESLSLEVRNAIPKVIKLVICELQKNM